MLLAARSLGLNKETLISLERAMLVEMDFTTEEEAERAYTVGVGYRDHPYPGTVKAPGEG